MRSEGCCSAALIALAVATTAPVSARASLIPRGFGMVYDDDRDITWMQDASPAVSTGYCTQIQPACANGLMTLAEAQAFVAWFNNDYAWPPGPRQWRLPITPSSPDTGCTASFNEGFNCRLSELGHLYYDELGNSAGEGGFVNSRPFVDIGTQMNYWTTWDIVASSTQVITFKFRTGQQVRSDDIERHYVWLVQDGDIAPRTECNNGIDDDGDGKIDMDDPGCHDPGDDDESNLDGRYRNFGFRWTPTNFALAELVNDGMPWCPMGLPGCPGSRLSFRDHDHGLPAYMDSLGRAIWKVANASVNPKALEGALNELRDVLRAIPNGRYFGKGMKERLAGALELEMGNARRDSATDLLASPVFIESLNAIDLDWRAPMTKAYKVKKGRLASLDLDGAVHVGLTDVVKPGEVTLRMAAGYSAFPTDRRLSPTWPFLSYSIDFTGQIGSKGSWTLAFHVKPLRFAKGISEIRVLRLDRDGLTDVTAGTTKDRAFVMARSDRPGTFIVVGKDRLKRN